MAILGLGYIGLGVSDVAAWRDFATGVLGIMAVDGADGGLKLRVDTRAWRIAIEPDPVDDILYAGWEVAGADALEAMIMRLEAAAVAVTRDDGTLARKRGVMGLARFTDPAGVVGELLWGATERGELPFVSPVGVSGFRTGEQGLGHIVIAAGMGDLAAVDDFYRNVLGFQMSDRIDMTVMSGITIPVTFLHVNPRHHSFAFAPGRPGSTTKLLHFMLETNALDDVGFALDRCAAANVPLALTLGRHVNDHMVSFYAYTPSGFEVEYGWGARDVETDKWTVTRHDAISLWGHKRGAPPPAAPPAPPPVAAPPAQSSPPAPVLLGKGHPVTTADGLFVEGEGWRIHYTVKGKGPPLILLHGGGPGATGMSNYGRNIDALAAHYTTYAIDFPGWGKSSKNLAGFGARGAFMNGARAVKAFMDGLGIAKAHVVGNSFGGSSAFYLALEYPEAVDRLVTMGPGGAWIEGQGPTPGIIQLMTYYLGEGPTREKLAAFLHNLVHDTSVLTPELIEQRFAASNDPEIVANAPLRPPPGGPPPKEAFLSNDPRLATLPHRALMIWGQQDKVNLPAGAASFSAVPNQDVVLFAQCGHWAQWEHADKFNELVLWFLGRD